MKTQAELLDLLRNKVRAPIEAHAEEILDSFGDDNERLAAFQRARADLDGLITRLESEELRNLGDQLDSLSEELKAGTADLQNTLTTAKNVASAAKVFWRVVGLAARIIALA